MTIQSDVLRVAFFAQMSASPLPEYSGDAVILRACKLPAPNSLAHDIYHSNVRPLQSQLHLGAN